MGAENVPLRMGHQAQDPACGIADPRDVFGGAVRIPGIRRGFALRGHVPEDDLAVLVQPAQHVPILRHEFSLRMGDRKVEDLLNAPCEHAYALLGPKIHPPVLELARIVVRQRGLLLLPGAVERGEQAGLDEHLEAITYAEDELPISKKLLDLALQLIPQFVRQDLPRGHIVAVCEPARYRQDLIFRQRSFSPSQFVDVHQLRVGPRQTERVLRLIVAIRTCCPQDEGFGFRHF